MTKIIDFATRQDITAQYEDVNPLSLFDAPVEKPKKQYGREYGEKYDVNLDIKEIAKLVRKQLNAQFTKANGWKLSVKISRYSGGQSMRVNILEAPADVIGDYFDFNWFEAREGDDIKHADAFRVSEKTNEIKGKMKAIVDQYNYDGSDSMTDYFDVNFYSFVEFDYELRQKAIEYTRALYSQKWANG